MSDETVEHRFIQIHQACESIIDQKNDFWSTLALPSTSAIATSHMCEKIYNGVSNKKLDLLLVIQNLQNLVITCTETPKQVVFLRSITRLLVLNVSSSRIQFGHVKNTGRTHNHKLVYQIHPFVVIIRQKASLYYYILNEIDHLFANFDVATCLQVLSAFMTALFLTDNNVESSSLINRLTNSISTSNALQLLPQLFDMAKELLIEYPLHKDDIHYFYLVDWLIWLNMSGSAWSIPCQKLQVNSFLYTLIDRALTSVTDGKSIVSHLIRLERVLANSETEFNFDVMWTSLSYALLKVQTVEEQKYIVNIMKQMRNLDLASNIILRVAYIPYYQLLSELNDKSASDSIQGLKNEVLTMIAYLDHNETPLEQAEEYRIKLTHDVNLYVSTYGMLSRIICHLEYIYTEEESPILDETYCHAPDSVLTLTLLFSASFVFSQDEESTVYSRMAEISCLLETCYKFPLLLYFLRRLHASSENAFIVTHILKDVIPTLVDVNDPVITSKVLQVILTSINHSGSPDSSMASLGIKALEHTHELQPRVWQELKKVFAEWVLRRKSGTVRRRIDLTKTGPIKMELTVLTTMRNVCKSRARECAPDILPMVISLLQTCQDLSMASLSIMVDIINTCVQAGLVESRSIWNIAVVYLAQFSLDQGVTRSILLVKQLCRFYSIAGKKDDVSEPYLQFKDSLLQEYILPLVQSDNEYAISYALDALSNFPAQDIASILPEKAMDYILQCTNGKPNKNQHKVLVTLMSNELDHMRRGLFKGEAKQQQTLVEDPAHKIQVKNEGGEVVGERELAMASSFINSWDDTRVAPGLRSGYASAILHIIDQVNNPDNVKGVTMEAISKTKWYRCMVTSFTDVSLTDHLMIRVSSIQSWKTFFKNALSGTENDMEVIVSFVLKDLLSRLERSTVPGVTCNITLALTGLVSTARMFIPSFAASCATEIIEVLMKNYIVLSGSPLSHSAHLMSEEVQFAAKFALGHLAAFVINNDKLASKLYKVLMDSATSTNNKSRNIDTAIDLVQYANGYAAGHYIASLAMWPTVTEQIESMKDTGIQSLISYCSSPITADSRVLGIMMGLASKLKPTYMGPELSFAVGNLKSYLAGEGINKGLLFGSTWLAAAGALNENQIDYDISGTIESVMTAASADINSAQHFYNFSIPYAQIQFHSYIYGTDDQAETLYWDAFEPLLNSIQNDDASSNYRIASLFSMGSLLGVEYLNSDDNARIYTEAENYRPALRNRALDKLAFVAGLNSKSAPIGNLKSGRIAAAICGKVIESTKTMIDALKTATDPQDNSGEKSSITLLSASSEPLSYSRLNSNTSYIRAAFDRLVAIESVEDKIESMYMLLESLTQTPGPLPPVNWFTLVTKISKLSSSLRALCLLFAATHATSSLSLSEFLLTQMTSIFTAVRSKRDLDMTVCDVFFAGKGLGAVLELAGLPRPETKQDIKRRGMSAVVKKITISESRALEILQLLGQKYQYFDYDTQYTLLSNVLEHLPAVVDENKVKFVASIRDVIMQSMVMYTFTHADKDDLRHSGYEKVVRQLVACSVTDIAELFPTGRSEDWKDVVDTDVFAKMTALCEFYRLHKNKTPVKYMSSGLVHLIGMNPYQDTTLYVWDMMAETMRVDKEELAWMLRVLDAFVVYVGSMPETEDAIDNLGGSLETGLSSILDAWKMGSPIACCDKTKALETTFALGNFVNTDHKIEQEQIVKRIFKLYDMTQDFIVPSSFLNRLIHALPFDTVKVI
ncbi:hypothetical protein MFLAVUS_005578 [Mucor flavus]|uniref:DUF3730 domain-containing protein n=1 Tax=Mucor flavus TaxID=439312 RepID=A0ABP9YZ55_9FUNG